MTELTKEQLIEEAKLKIAIAKCHPNSGMARVEGELFKIALASLEAEPIAWVCGENIILFNPDTVEAYAKRAEISPKPLFAAPPVLPDRPVVSLEAEPVVDSEWWTLLRQFLIELQDRRKNSISESGIRAETLNDLIRHIDRNLDIDAMKSPFELSSEIVDYVNKQLRKENA